MKKFNIIVFSAMLFCFCAFNIQAATLLPDKLTGKILFCHIANMKTKTNPLANQNLLMHFVDDSHYLLENLDSNEVVKEAYNYKIIDEENSIALLTVKNKLISYMVVLVPQSKYSGLYIYKQFFGSLKPSQRMNFSFYTIVDPKLVFSH